MHSEALCSFFLYSHFRYGKSVDQVDSVSSKSGEPWYREVAELRKQANEFRVSRASVCTYNDPP